MGEIAADRARLGAHGHGAQPHPGEGAQIGHEHLVVGFDGALFVEVERIGILHQELAAPHHAEAWSDLIAEFPLDMVENARHVLVGFCARAEDFGDHLLVGGTVQHLAFVAIRDAQHLLAIRLVAAALPPQLRRLNGRHEQLDGARAVLFLADDLLDLAQDAVTERQPGIDPRARLAGQPGPQHQPVGNDLRFLGIVAQQWQKIAAEAHSLALTRWQRASWPRLLQ